jgi:two-component system phosphate regulon sensor histidine kinase PhoR
MKLGFRMKLFVASVALMAGVGAACVLYLHRELERSLEERADATLASHADTVRLLAETSAVTSSPDALQRACTDLAATQGTHVAILAPDRSVLCDSGHALDTQARREDYRAQPEIAAAFAGRRSRARRYSPSFEAEMVHEAVPFAHPAGCGVVRVSVRTADMVADAARMRVPFLVTALLGILGALLVSWIASHMLSRTLRSLVTSAHALAEGERHGNAEVHSLDELGGLAGSLDRVADDIEATVAALATERARLEGVLEGMSEAVLMLDRERRVVLSNSAAARLLGLAGNPAGQPFIELVRAPAIHRLLAEAAEPSACEFELPGVPARRVLAQVTPSREGSDCVVVMYDVTSIRQLETVRRDFVANVSHELRTPVTIIRANAETLLDGAMSDPVHGPRILEALHRNAERLSRLVDDLLDLARLEASRFQLESDEIAVQGAVQGAVDSVERAAQAKDIRIELDVDPALRVRADDKALDQILVNYLDNAVKYTPGGGRVRVSAHRREDKVRIEVIDNGPGISPQHRARIFERFYRVDPGRSRAMGGTGLGLSIVRHLAETLDGDAGMEPAQPHGSIFWVSLPSA